MVRALKSAASAGFSVATSGSVTTPKGTAKIGTMCAAGVLMSGPSIRYATLGVSGWRSPRHGDPQLDRPAVLHRSPGGEFRILRLERPQRAFFVCPGDHEEQHLDLREQLRCHTHRRHAIRAVYRDREVPGGAREVVGGEQRRRMTVGTEPEETKA